MRTTQKTDGSQVALSAREYDTEAEYVALRQNSNAIDDDDDGEDIIFSQTITTDDDDVDDDDDDDATLNRNKVAKGDDILAATLQKHKVKKHKNKTKLEKEMKDFPEGVEIDVKTALEYLRRCRRFSCIQKAHRYLGNRVHYDIQAEEMEDLPQGAHTDLETALEYLRRCHSFACVKKAHGYLNGRTRFNFPHFFLAGWQKCATTSVNAYFRHHPQYMWGLRKESHWFSQCKSDMNSPNCYAQSPSQYLREFLRLEEAAAGGLEHITFDASVDYAQKGQPLASELYSLFPWIKIVLFLREPISRIISYSRMYTEKNHAKKGCFDGLALYDCLRPFFEERGEQQRSGHGHYDEALEGWLQVFPRDQIKIIQFEELQEDPNTIVTELKKFLGMDPNLPKIVLQNLNSRKQGGWPMELAEYTDLVGKARPHAERLASMLDSAGLADGKKWIARWEFVWNRQIMEGCDAQGQCLVNSN
jgi:hypothetical protein